MNGNKILIIHSFLFLKLISHSSEAYFQNQLIFRYFHQHIWDEVNLQPISLFAPKLFVGPLQTRWRHLEERNTKYQITEYRMHASKHQTHAHPKISFFVVSLSAFCKQARDTFTTDSEESQFVEKDKTDHLSLFMRPGSSFHVMLVSLYVIITISWDSSQSIHLLDVTLVLIWMCSPYCALSYLSLCGCVHQLILHLNIDKSAENTTRLDDACKGTRDHWDKKSSNWQTMSCESCLCSNAPSRFYVYLYL